jgi:hypothetical protein
MDVALGCLYGMQTLMRGEWILNMSPEERLRLALCASERFNCNVRRPFTVISDRPDEIK